MIGTSECLDRFKQPDLSCFAPHFLSPKEEIRSGNAQMNLLNSKTQKHPRLDSHYAVTKRRRAHANRPDLRFHNLENPRMARSRLRQRDPGEGVPALPLRVLC